MSNSHIERRRVINEIDVQLQEMTINTLDMLSMNYNKCLNKAKEQVNNLKENERLLKLELLKKARELSIKSRTINELRNELDEYTKDVETLMGRIREQPKNAINWEDEFCCPITHEVMKEPVVAKDGHTYEKRAIIQWFSQNGTKSPMTNNYIYGDLVPNYQLKKMIEKWKRS